MEARGFGVLRQAKKLRRRELLVGGVKSDPGVAGHDFSLWKKPEPGSRALVAADVGLRTAWLLLLSGG